MTASHVMTGPDETRRFAALLAAMLRPGDVIALDGPLGAGKTLFVRGLAEGLGLDPADVTSPTFTLCQEYGGGRLPMTHIDAYRMAGPDELDTIGWSEMVAAGDHVIAVEWADRIAAALPRDRLIITFDHVDEHSRRLHVEPRGEWIERMKTFSDV